MSPALFLFFISKQDLSEPLQWGTLSQGQQSDQGGSCHGAETEGMKERPLYFLQDWTPVGVSQDLDTLSHKHQLLARKCLVLGTHQVHPTKEIPT